MCVPLASDSSETVEVIIVKLGTVSASDMRMHRVLVIVTLTFIQGHTDQNHENKCLIISKTTQAMPIKFAVKIVQLKVYLAIASPMTLTFIHSHKCVSNDCFLTCSISDNNYFKTCCGMLSKQRLTCQQC